MDNRKLIDHLPLDLNFSSSKGCITALSENQKTLDWRLESVKADSKAPHFFVTASFKA